MWNVTKVEQWQNRRMWKNENEQKKIAQNVGRCRNYGIIILNEFLSPIRIPSRYCLVFICFSLGVSGVAHSIFMSHVLDE